MSPLLFESPLFLKLNHKYWDVDLVSEGMKISRSKKKIISAMNEEYGARQD